LGLILQKYYNPSPRRLINLSLRLIKVNEFRVVAKSEVSRLIKVKKTGGLPKEGITFD